MTSCPDPNCVCSDERARGRAEVLMTVRRYLPATEADYIEDMVTASTERREAREVPGITARASRLSAASAARSTAAIWPSTGEPEH